MLNNLQQMHLKLLQEKVIQEWAEAVGDFISNKSADKITSLKKVTIE